MWVQARIFASTRCQDWAIYLCIHFSFANVPTSLIQMTDSHPITQHNYTAWCLNRQMIVSWRQLCCLHRLTFRLILAEAGAESYDLDITPSTYTTSHHIHTAGCKRSNHVWTETWLRWCSLPLLRCAGRWDRPRSAIGSEPSFPSRL